MPALPTRALILRSIDFSEADRIVTLLTEQHGKLAVMVRGARSSRRRFAGVLEPFAVLQVELVEGRGQLGRLAAARVEVPFLRLLGRLEHMRHAGFVLEMLRSLLPERQAEPQLFDDLVEYLTWMDAEAFDVPFELSMSFLGRALALLGFAPQLDVCGVCGREPRPMQAVQLSPARGQIQCRACGGAAIFLSGRSRALLSATFGGGFRDVAAGAWPDEQREQLARALRASLEHCLERTIAFV